MWAVARASDARGVGSKSPCVVDAHGSPLRSLRLAIAPKSDPLEVRCLKRPQVRWASGTPRAREAAAARVAPRRSGSRLQIGGQGPSRREVRPIAGAGESAIAVSLDPPARRYAARQAD
jgi:hypothetical protein